jgi:hypothetical protein
MGFISERAHSERRKFIDYIHGLLRHEIHEGDDNEKRLEVLSKIHYDLLYVEHLEHAKGWKKSLKGKDDLDLAYDKIQRLTAELEEMKTKLDELLGGINSSSSKKDILALAEKVKEEVA